MPTASSRHAAAGAIQRKERLIASRRTVGPKSTRLTLADGRRGFQERNWFSS